MAMILTVRWPETGREEVVEDVIAFDVDTDGDTTRIILDQTRQRAAEYEGEGIYLVSGTDPEEVND